MFLEELRLFQFRNLNEVTLPFAPGLNLLLGKNGQGKSNLLEAIHVLSSGRSFRTSRLKEVIQWEKDSTSVFGRVQHRNWEGELGIALEGGRRKAFRDGDQITGLDKYLGNLVTVSFAPAELDLVQRGPEYRRKFFDRYVSFLSPSIFQSLVRYQKALRGKNVLLKERYPDREKVRAWNQVLAPLAADITHARARFISDLERKSSQILASFAPNDGVLTLRLKSNLLSDEGVERDSEEVYGLLEDSLEQEILQRAAALGPHRDDMIISLNGVAARSFASQGQCRSIVLALIVGVLELLEETFEETPVVLLDDVESELDQERGALFFETVLRKKCQIILTGTHSELANRDFAKDNGLVYAVDNGRVE